MRILKTVIPLLAVMLSVCLTACSNDDDDVKNNIVKPTHVLSEIQCGNTKAILNYDSNSRFTNATLNNNDIVLGYLWSEYRVTYDNNSIHMIDPEGQSTLKIQKGLLDTWHTIEDGVIVFKYEDSNKMKYFVWDDEIATQFTWSDNVIVSAQSYNDYYTVDYFANTDLNPNAIAILNAIVISECIEDDYPWIFAQNGYLGKLPEKMIKSVYYRYSNSTRYTYNISYGNVDSNGFPSTFTIDGEEYILKWTKI